MTEVGWEWVGSSVAGNGLATVGVGYRVVSVGVGYGWQQWGREWVGHIGVWDGSNGARNGVVAMGQGMGWPQWGEGNRMTAVGQEMGW